MQLYINTGLIPLLATLSGSGMLPLGLFAIGAGRWYDHEFGICWWALFAVDAATRAGLTAAVTTLVLGLCGPMCRYEFITCSLCCGASDLVDLTHGFIRCMICSYDADVSCGLANVPTPHRDGMGGRW
jgi:hypothetical protein